MTSSGNERTTSRSDLTYPWALVAVLVAVFLGLAMLTKGPNTLELDLDASTLIQGLGGWANSAARFGDILGESPIAFGFLIVALIVAIILRQERIVWYLLIAAVGRTFAMVFKGLFESPRPTDAQVTVADTFSALGYPSGHATTSAVMMGAMAFLVATAFTDSRFRWMCVGVAALGVALTAFARIYLGAHWFTDTLGGTLVGTTIVLVSANLSAMMVNWRQQRAISQE